MQAATPDPAAVLDAILARLDDPILQQLGLYWRSKLHGRRLPARRDIDPRDVPALLPHVMLWDVQRDPMGFRGRLVGTYIVEIAGRDATGQSIETIDDVGAIEAEYRAVAETSLPRHQERQAHWPNREHRHYGRLLLPLAEDGSRVDMLLGCINAVAAERGR